MTATAKHKPQRGVTHVTRSSDNLFVDLGLPAARARKLQTDTDALIFERMRLREQLADELNEWMAAQHSTQAELAQALKISRPRVSDLARRQLAKFSIDTLVDLLLRAGKHVEIRVG